MNQEQRKIKVPDLNSISHWPEKPYRWMITGIIRAISEIEGEDANYLVGLGLFCYSEIIGREIMKFQEPEKNWDTWNTNKPCFNKFLKEYMGYGELLDRYPNLYDWFRNGLCHNFTIKVIPGGKSGVFHYFDDPDIVKFQNVGVDTSRGIMIANNTSDRILVIEPYLKDFSKGVEKFLKESGQIIQ